VEVVVVLVVVVLLLKEWSQEEFQRFQVVVVGVSTEEVVQLEVEFEEVDQLSSLPVKAYLFQVMASQALALVMIVMEEAIGVVELGQQLERKQCFPHNLRMRSHCWSQFLFWVHLQCWKFLREELPVVGVGIGVVGIKASQGRVFDISLALHLFL